MKFLMTVDVERISFEDNCYHDSIAERVANEGLPKLFKLFEKYGINATFYVTSKYAQLAKQSLLEIKKRGYEIGCHGFDHSDYYDLLNYPQQVDTLKKSKSIIEEIIGEKIISFRAPALRINKYTVKALERAGFQTDSSVSSQRFDGPFTSGAFKKLSWITAHRLPYKMNYNNPYKKGNSSITEIPVTALIWPFIGTHMRLSPNITSYFQYLYMAESKLTNKPLVFLIHPNELISFSYKKTIRRGSWFSDNIRHKLKMKNLGIKAIDLLENVIMKAQKKGADFFSVRQYLKEMSVK